MSKKCANYDKLYIFETANSNMPKYLQNFQNLNLNSRKTENVQILFTKVLTKLLRKSCTICFILFKVFLKSYKMSKSNGRN